jgi:hypothetical protein
VRDDEVGSVAGLSSEYVSSAPGYQAQQTATRRRRREVRRSPSPHAAPGEAWVEGQATHVPAHAALYGTMIAEPSGGWTVEPDLHTAGEDALDAFLAAEAAQSNPPPRVGSASVVSIMSGWGMMPSGPGLEHPLEAALWQQQTPSRHMSDRLGACSPASSYGGRIDRPWPDEFDSFADDS